MKNKLPVLSFVFLSFSYSYSQCGDTLQVITVQNPSFEGASQPHVVPNPWTACYGTPDTQPGQWGLTQAPSEGASYISALHSGDCDYPCGYTEGASQQLSSCMTPGREYSFSIDLAFSPVYNTAEPGSCYGSLQIVAGNSVCDQSQILWQSGPITDSTWQSFNIIFTANSNWCYISMRPYFISTCSGYINIMIDNMSPIVSLDNSYTINITSPPQGSEQSCSFAICGTTDSIPQSVILSGNFSGSPVFATVSGLDWNENIFYPYNFSGTDTIYASAVFSQCTVTKTLVINVTDIIPYFVANGSGYTVEFTDSTINTSGNILSWSWSFGDGATDTVQNPVHIYDTAGTYNVCLMINDSCGTDSFCGNVTVCAMLSSEFSYSDSSLMINFTYLASEATSFLWNFGDSQSDTNQNPVHVYDTAGIYIVCLTVYNSCGTATFCDSITVNCDLPEAGFMFTDSFLTVIFSDNSSGALAWKWNFGDGKTDTAQNPVHVFDSEGIYEVCLTVLNNCGYVTYCDSISVFLNGIFQNKLKPCIIAFPNPSLGKFIISISQLTYEEHIQFCQFTIYNVLGETICRLPITDYRQSVIVDLSAQPPGIYYCTLQTENGVITEKLVLNK